MTILLVLATTAHAACSGPSTVSPTAPTATTVPAASLVTPAQHLDDVLNVMSREAANSGNVNWNEARAELQAAAANARSGAMRIGNID